MTEFYSLFPTRQGVILADLEQGRITDKHTLIEAATVLIDGSYISTKIMGPILMYLGDQAGDLLVIMDQKRLYGHRIAELFRLCGSNIGRFVYHVYVELPNQETGEVVVFGSYFDHLESDASENPAFYEKRSFWQPGSFWGLQQPPTSTHYEYPII